ncbi:MAG: hypothetical protein Q4C54_05385 [Clostridia bacterium]|nr:hypothetical protein [Clostridia bacterium]
MKKRLFALLTVLVLCLACFASALAADSISDIKFTGTQWSEENCKPSMLNVGYARVPLGKTLHDMNKEGGCKTIGKSMSINQVEGLLDDGYTFYNYAKFGGRNVAYLKIKANLIITAPDGRYYRTDDNWTITDGHGTIHYSWFFDITQNLKDIQKDNGGRLPAGNYDFSMFFNGYTFRTTTLKLK